MQMVGIGKFYLCADLLQIHCGNGAFDRGCRPDIHKNRGLDHAMYGVKLTPFCFSISFYQFIHNFLPMHMAHAGYYISVSCNFQVQIDILKRLSYNGLCIFFDGVSSY